MAIDTRQKRFSMLSLNQVPAPALFEADGTVDADDRAHLLRLYSGITLAAIVDIWTEIPAASGVWSEVAAASTTWTEI